MHLKSFKMHMRFVCSPCQANHGSNHDASLLWSCIFMRFLLNAQILLDSLKHKTYDDELRREDLLNYFRQSVSQKVLLIFLYAFLLCFVELLYIPILDFEVVQACILKATFNYRCPVTVWWVGTVVGKLVTFTGLKNYPNLDKFGTSLVLECLHL